MTIEPHLEQAIQLAATSGRTQAAILDELLPAWRATRAPEIAALIEEISAELELHQEPLVLRRKPWWSCVGDGRSADVGRLVTALARMEPVLARELVPETFAWPPDPRVATLLLHRLDALDLDGGARQRHLDALVAIADPRSTARLRELAGRSGIATVAQAADRFDSPERRGERAPLTALAGELVGRLAELRRRRRAERAALLAPIYAQPEDDDVRLVFADWALEQGDPWGEFITLQYRLHRGRISEPERRRAALLQRHHQRDWLGALAPLLEETTFERGFPVAGRLSHLDLATVGRPEWATLRELRLAAPRAPGIADLLADPALRSLRTIERITDGVLAELERRGRPLPFESLQVIGSHPRPTEPGLRLLGCLPRLRELHVPTLLDWLDVGPLVDRLETLTVDLTYQSQRGAKIVAGLLRRPPRLRLQLLPDLEFRFGENGTEAQLTRPLRDPALELLARLPAGTFVRLRVVGDRPAGDDVREAVQHALRHHPQLAIEHAVTGK